MKYDVVVIGSGFGGLVCASILSREGRSVLVLERQVQPGGCIQSYQRGGFSFDTGFHYVGGLAEGQNLHRIFASLGLMDLPWHRLDAEGFDQVTIDDQTYAFAEGYDAFVESLAVQFPQEREALQQYVRMLQQVDAVKFGSSDAYQLFGTSAYEFLSRTFHDPLLLNVISGTAMKMELRKVSLPLFSFAHGNSSFIQSSWRLKGDGNLLVGKMVDDIKANGGAVVCKAEVQELIEKDGRIAAARCSNGESYEGDTFISDIHPSQTFALVKESSVMKRIYRMRMSNMENTFGMLTVSLMLKPGMLRYFNHNKYVYRKANVWTFYEEDAPVGGIMISARVPEEGDFVRQVDLLTPMPWNLCEQWTDTTVGRRGEAYLSMKEGMADACIDLAETVLPGLSSMICGRYISTPLTYRDYTLTPNGSAFGVRKDCRSLVLTMLSSRTPLQNLLLTGQNLMLPGLEGVAMTSLLTCSEIIGKDKIQTILEN